MSSKDASPCKKCKRPTTHQSEYCEPCRTKICDRCGVRFTMTKGPIDFGRKHCAKCRCTIQATQKGFN